MQNPGSLPSQSRQESSRYGVSVQDIRARVDRSRTAQNQSESTQIACDTVASPSGRRASSTAGESTHNRDSGLDNVAEDDDSGSVGDERGAIEPVQSSEGQA